MSNPSPLLDIHRAANADLMAYGPGEQGGAATWVVGGFGPVELEYAAIRRDAAVLDLPQRAVLEVRGPERLEFLNRMLTQDLRGMTEGRAYRSFWLNKKGRIDADLRLLERPDRTLLEVDVLAAPRTIEGLGRYIIMEDVSVADVTSSTHRLALHGPRALELLSTAAGTRVELSQDRATSVRWGAGEALVFREDSAGEIGLEMIVEARFAAEVYASLIAAGSRPGGWHAWNVARIEAGTPLYNVDFGPESLPAETGVLNDRVSFTKGCYLGQEIVARLHARGQPKQIVVGVKFEIRPDGSTSLPVQPMGGTPLAPASAPETPVGSISSSALGPMLGSAPIALASVRAAHAAPGTELVADVGGLPLRGTVQPGLRFWPR